MVCRTWLVVIFLGLCLCQGSRGGESGASAPATPEQVHQTVELAIKYVRDESASWLNTRKCAACHHAPLALWSLSEAERQGYAIDKKWLTDTAESLLGNREKLLGSKIF